MINAKEANEIAKDNCGRYNHSYFVTQQLDEIESLIKESANLGYFMVFYPGELYSEVKEILINRGYKCKNVYDSRTMNLDRTLKVFLGTNISWLINRK